MSIFSKGEREITADAKSTDRGLKLSLKIGVTREGAYGSDSTVAEITLDKSLVSSSDTRIKEILKEIEGVLSDVYDDAENQMKRSRNLSDGLIKEESKKGDF